MHEEIDDDLIDIELEGDALERGMRKLEDEAERLLHYTNDLLQELNKERAKREAVKQEDEKTQNTEEGSALS